ncbi:MULTISPECIES: M28 family peptidase [Salinibaculum]|uniref:M28 family peptidase n=1 Tax=Salinibaculum TaxID=2732368 RepID=UPI0030CC5B3B
MHWIGETFTSDAGWSHLERLVDIAPRMAGSDGERAAAEATRDALSEAGARDARLAEFDIHGWTRGTSSIDADGTEQDCIALPRSPSGSVEGPLVDLGYGLPEDFEAADLDGAVVLCRSDVPEWFDRFMHRREKYYRAVQAGAAAFVFSNHVPGCLPPTGSVGTEASPVGEIPAVGVSREVGARLARRFEGEPVTVSVDAENDDATSQNVHAELGPETDERVLLTSHVDGHDISEGAMDNGAGTAMVVEVARALAARERDPDAPDLGTRVEFVTFGAEEVGLLGSGHLAGAVDPDSVRTVVNLDGVCRGRTLEVTAHGSDTLVDAARTVAADLDHPMDVRPDHVPHSDHWPFVARGVPGYMVAGSADESGRGWGHTHADTLDKLEARTLREGAILVAELVAEVAGRSVPRLDTEEVAATLERTHEDEAMRVTGDWPFDQ